MSSCKDRAGLHGLQLSRVALRRRDPRTACWPSEAIAHEPVIEPIPVDTSYELLDFTWYASRVLSDHIVFPQSLWHSMHVHPHVRIRLRMNVLRATLASHLVAAGPRAHKIAHDKAGGGSSGADNDDQEHEDEATRI